MIFDSLFYDLEGEPIGYEEWCNLFWGSDRTDRTAAYTEIEPDVYISTVWLGIDLRHGLADAGVPLIYETRIIGGPCDGRGDRYPNRDAALAGHDRAVALAREAAR